MGCLGTPKVQKKSLKNALELGLITHLEKTSKNVNFLIPQTPLDRAETAARAPFSRMRQGL